MKHEDDPETQEMKQKMAEAEMTNEMTDEMEYKEDMVKARARDEARHQAIVQNSAQPTFNQNVDDMPKASIPKPNPNPNFPDQRVVRPIRSENMKREKVLNKPKFRKRLLNENNGMRVRMRKERKMGSKRKMRELAFS